MREGALYATSLTAASRPNPHACPQPRLIRNDSPFSRRCVRSRAGRCVATRRWRGRRVCRGMPALLRVCSRSLPSPVCPGIGCCVQTDRSPSHRVRTRHLSRREGCAPRAFRLTACGCEDRQRVAPIWTPSCGRRLPTEPSRSVAIRTGRPETCRAFSQPCGASCRCRATASRPRAAAQEVLAAGCAARRQRCRENLRWLRTCARPVRFGGLAASR
jgi:hypothetical protein